MTLPSTVAADTTVARMPEMLPAAGLGPGIYFNLSEDRYHQDSALGSSDIREIRKDPETWWRASGLNPDAAERAAYQWSTKATVLGTAVHKLVLEGRAPFELAYARRPDDAPGSSPSEKGALTKQANAAARASNRISLHGDEWLLCERTAGLITAHPDLATALNGGANEVSVIWRRPDGIMCKARFDRLKVHGIGDIKTIENEHKKALPAACRYDVASRRYDMQAEHYLEARAQFRALVRAGLVFMVDVHGQPERAVDSSIVGATSCLTLATECATTSRHERDEQGTVFWTNGDGEADVEPGYAFQFVFVQKSSPGVWSCTLSPGNDILQVARMHIEEAIATYRNLSRIVSPGKPWPPQWRVEELDPSELPAFWGRE